MASSAPADEVSKYGLPRFFGTNVIARLPPSPPASVLSVPESTAQPVARSATLTASAVSAPARRLF